MNAVPLAVAPHNMLWRKIRRRWWFGPFPLSLFVTVMYIVPPLCIVAWLWKDVSGELLAQVMRWLWFMCTLSVFLPSVLMLLCLKAARPGRPVDSWIADRERFLKLLLSVLCQSLTLVALLCGRIDCAALSSYGATTISTLWDCLSRKSCHALLQALYAAAIIAAVIAKEVWLVAAGSLLSQLIKPLFKPSLREIVSQKPSRAEVVDQERRLCATGGG